MSLSCIEIAKNLLLVLPNKLIIANQIIVAKLSGH